MTADDIELEVNNTIKSDLIDATRDIVIELVNGAILNGTLSQDQEGRALRRDTAINLSRWKAAEDAGLLGVVRLGEFELDERREVENEQGQRRTAFFPTENRNDMDDNRRLAVYNDAFPPVITNVIDFPFCDDSLFAFCSIVETTVCVVLEEGDDEETVKRELLDGLKAAFQDGRFEDSLA